MTKGAMYGVIILLVFVLIGMNYWIGQTTTPGEGVQAQGAAKQIDASDVKAVEDMEKKLGTAGSEEPGHEGHDHSAQPGMKGASAAGTEQAVGPVVKAGNPNAKVKVEAFVNTGADCHKKTIDLLKKVTGSDPDRVYVEVYDMNSSAGSSKMGEKGATCATVFVNNKSEYTLNEEGKTKAVNMSKKPNESGSTYNSEDVPLVIDQELKAAYGKGLKSVPKG